jgi:putative membrane protein
MLDFLPTLNALLNSTSAVFLLVGHRFIKRGNTQSHKKCMIGAVCTSVLFLISYLTYHYFHGTTRFLGEGWIRPVYFTILTSHTILAAGIVPLVIVTLRRGLKEIFDKHKRIARWTYPLWLYVSVTGVIIYVMLYHLYPAQ